MASSDDIKCTLGGSVKLNDLIYKALLEIYVVFDLLINDHEVRPPGETS